MKNIVIVSNNIRKDTVGMKKVIIESKMDLRFGFSVFFTVIKSLMSGGERKKRPSLLLHRSFSCLPPNIVLFCFSLNLFTHSFFWSNL